MPYYVFAWLSAFGYTFANIFGKLTSKYQIKNSWLFSFVYLFFGLIITVPLAIMNGAGIPDRWFIILVAGVVFALSTVFWVLSLSRLDVSVLSPLFNFRVVFAVLLGFFFLGERLGIREVWLMGMIVVAGFFATMDEKLRQKSFLTVNVFVGLLFMASLALFGLFINKAIAQTNYWTATLWSGVVATITLFVIAYPKFKTDLHTIKIKDLTGVLAMASLGIVGDLAANRAYSENLGVSSVIISLPLSMVVAYFLSIINPNLLEKHPWKIYVVRFGAAAVMIWGALQLSR